MADEQPAAASRRRSRGVEATARAEALERLKALRSGGRRSEHGGGYDFKLEDRIYDTVPEEEYGNFVARRREEVQGFIVDDDGLGYGDDGQEEDWSHAGLPPSSDESDGGGPSNRPKRKKTEKKEKEPQQKKINPSLAAAAAMMGKQRLSAMFTSKVYKNRDSNKVKSLDCENIVDDVIAEFAPDEADRERRRRGQLVMKFCPPIANNEAPTHAIIDANLMAKAETDRLVANNGDCLVSATKNCSDGEDKRLLTEVEVEKEVENAGDLETNRSVNEQVENVVEVKVEPVVKQEEEEEKGGRTLNAKITTEERDPSLSATAGWQAVRSGNGNVGGVADEVKIESSFEEQSEFELEADGSLPFYILDAHEEVFGANMGNLYLFGKVNYRFWFFYAKNFCMKHASCNVVH